MELRIAGLKTLPEVEPGNGLGPLIREAAGREGQVLDSNTILVVAQKIVSKSEGALVDLRTIQPSVFAAGWARSWNRDARVIELVLRESKRIVKMDRGVIVAETHHGFVAANAGVDQSNVPGHDFALVLPKDPDGSARCLRLELNCGAVIISDTFGRPWREGLINVAVGVSGIEAVEDLRGSQDRGGRSLSATILAQADELAAAGGLVMPKAGGVPVALIQGFEWARSEGSSRGLIRAPELDLFR
jgi:coenzyme F420-0:L-glutamate ligase / coenzyme F420-1:gamma-L-glutamate ligase